MLENVVVVMKCTHPHSTHSKKAFYGRWYVVKHAVFGKLGYVVALQCHLYLFCHVSYLIALFTSNFALKNGRKIARISSGETPKLFLDTANISTLYFLCQIGLKTYVSLS